MALFNKKLNTSNNEATTDPKAESNHYDNQDHQAETDNPVIPPNFGRKRVIIEEEVEEVEDDAPIPDEASPPHTRRVGIPTGIVEDAVETEDTPVTAPVVPTSKRKVQSQPVKRDRVSLSVDISRDLHARLRINSFKTGSPLGTIIEEMIVQCYPE